MKTKRMNVLLYGAMLVCCVHTLQGQTSRTQFFVSAGNHSIAVPLQKISHFTFHPTLQAGLEFTHWYGNHGRFIQSIALGAVYNRYNNKSFFISTEGIYRYQTGLGIYGETSLGVGYMHTFHPSPVYALQDDGHYKKVTDTGKPTLMVSLGLGLGYQFQRKTSHPFSVYTRYQPFITLPYSKDLIGLPQLLWQVGTRFTIN
ncbi:hypothetical protein [Xanthocytophaga agilis]|uniref:Uncharacterized protein n=1 Tax=Xanthocytophaga agilis TaxID=3048010 RepID=A0AAE3UF18_9BACT|nr:hypothetical protein [Xanthocytophaga agilis]MDJ1500088.1 hypothetical protein [Xanthocytophaga agilis]